jgi:hypothetical protein
MGGTVLGLVGQDVGVKLAGIGLIIAFGLTLQPVLDGLLDLG